MPAPYGGPALLMAAPVRWDLDGLATDGGEAGAVGNFLDVAFRFPAALFTFLLVVVIGYWLLVLFGVVDFDTGSGTALEPLGAEGDAGAGWGVAGLLAGLGLGGMPVSVALSLLVTASWFVSLAGGALLGSLEVGTWAMIGLGIAVLAAAVVLAWLIAWLLMLPLRHFFPLGPQSSRHDFVGRVCVIRTGTVTADFGQAEVTATDGSSAIVQVRKAGDDPLRAGAPAVIYDYDAKGEFFWVSPMESALGPNPEPHPNPHPEPEPEPHPGPSPNPNLNP